MSQQGKANPSCVPYRRKWHYLFLTSLVVIVSGWAFLVLWIYHPILSFFMLGFYLLASYFQAYCCYYQDCPYIGGFCPAISGIYPANVLASKITARAPEKSRLKFERHEKLAMLSWLGFVLFPLFWIYSLEVLLAGVYLLFHIGHFIAFALLICPACAVRNTCPGGVLQKQFLD